MPMKDYGSMQWWQKAPTKRQALPDLPLIKNNPTRCNITLTFAVICITIMVAGFSAREVLAKNSQPIEWLKLKVGDLQLPVQIGSLTTEHEPLYRTIARPGFVGVISEISISYYHSDSRTKASIRIIMPFSKASIEWGKKYFHHKKEERLKTARSNRHKTLEAYDDGDSFTTEYTYLKPPESKWRSRHLGKLTGCFSYLIDGEGEEGKVDHAFKNASAAADKALEILKKALQGDRNPGATKIGNYNLTLGELGFSGAAGEWIFDDIVFLKTGHNNIDRVKVTYNNIWAEGTFYVNLFFPNDWNSTRVNKRKDIKLNYSQFKANVKKRIKTRSAEMIVDNPEPRYDLYEYEYHYESSDKGQRRVVEKGKYLAEGSFHLESEIKRGTAVGGIKTLRDAAMEALYRIRKATKTQPNKTIYRDVVNGVREEKESGNRQLPPGQRGNWQSVVE